ncbi:MAG: bifunctional tRNA (5-methylaminomethyl-2-thiouridine)(34)-methyltransferase MnmD/FAD-dependent 5-carboxymethylaminomethyl-2-thiouridine(34) oxidoreductase MnmC [Pseudomonadota bacterium]
MADDDAGDDEAHHALGCKAEGFFHASPPAPTAARVSWDGPDGAPRSRAFDDIYYADDGVGEARHVFIGGTGLADLFAAARERACDVVVGETGFGTGLNFLAAWDLWRRDERAQGARFIFMSCELHPLTTADFARAHAGIVRANPELGDLSDKLRSAYPAKQTGAYDLTLGDNVRLRLIFDEVGAAFARERLEVDAWFLDGFAPSKNPDMWRAEVMAQIARLSKPGARLATFTVAGVVRRGLEAAGFATEKRPGFGRKRDMLAAQFKAAEPSEGAATKNARTRITPWFDENALRRIAPGARVAIIGAGIAGAAAADALRRRGCPVVLFDPGGPAAGASGNPGGLVMPRLDLGDGAPARFFRAAYLHALGTLTRIDGTGNIYNPCGASLRAAEADEKTRQEKLLAADVLPASHIEARDDGLFFPQGGVVDPRAYVEALVGDALVQREAVTALESGSDGVAIITTAGVQRFDAAIVANGCDALRFAEARTLPLTGVAGQVDWLRDIAAPAHAIAAGPYAAPAPGGGLLIGATYEKVARGETPAPSENATRKNLEAAATLGVDVPSDARTQPRVAVRCQTPDRMPIVGPAPDWGHYATFYDDLRFGRPGPYPPAAYAPNVFFFTGLGSRGLVTAPFCAEILAASMLGEAPPVDADVAAALHAGRFFIRDFKRARPVKART